MILIEKKQEQMAMRRNIETRKFRRRLADFLCKRYKVDMGGLDFSSKSELNIIEAVRHKWRVTLASKAAKVMIEWAKKQKLKRLKEETEAKHHIAAFRIQLHWRKFNACVVLPRKRRQLEHQSALTIQRCYRGYRVRCSDELYKLRGFRRIDLMHHSFMEVKNDLMAKCSIVISKCWRMFSAISQAKLKKSPQTPQARPDGVSVQTENYSQLSDSVHCPEHSTQDHSLPQPLKANYFLQPQPEGSSDPESL
eukprot:CAMPEP_0204903834 /NCGR_PEP_ID=MMETSP1397-20131031/4510_1 /ASSEMBLY_ACC=CAM_ASM_000891 /TAXON_ID=49980 /ORGANISM="Climacostomum Climacostomum virens, Strain Stock W-24" /LENGTH=250 /DNA_ID=CAMNT_0052072539 /DNA_START=601 /DNA_END=1352 /DNA_ORIENTATION=-